VADEVDRHLLAWLAAGQHRSPTRCRSCSTRCTGTSLQPISDALLLRLDHLADRRMSST
jgi:hypothetical protein